MAHFNGNTLAKMGEDGKRQRIKHVVSENQVAHLWANKAQDSARKPGQCSNMYFDGDTIYSYGRHFPIARHALTAPRKGKPAPCVLFTTRTYSSTTSGHLSTVRGALHGLNLTTFYVHDVNANCETVHRENFKDIEARRGQVLAKVDSTRQGAGALAREVESLTITANEYAKAFGLADRLTITKAVQKRLDDAKARAEKALAARSEKDKEERARQEQARAARLEAVKDAFPGLPDRLEATQ